MYGIFHAEARVFTWLRFVVLCAAVFVSAVLYSCGGKAMADETNPAHERITQTISASSFAQKQSVTLSPVGQSGFFSTLKIVDTFLLCADYRAPVILQVFSATTGKLLGEIVTRGNEKGQCLSVANILPAREPGTIWLYDITLGKFMKINIADALRDHAYMPQEEWLLGESARGLKSPCYISDSLFAGCTYTRDDCRFLVLNNRSEVLAHKGALPARKKEWPQEEPGVRFPILSFIYAANLVKHPGKDVFVAAYNKTDRLEFYKDGALQKILKGPIGFDPKVSFAMQQGELNVVETEETVYSFTSVETSSNFVYCLYSGRDGNNTCAATVLVFDWEGNPVKQLDLDKEACSISVKETGNETLVYAIEKETGNLLTSKFTTK
jgi:hypothetical protein